MLKKVVKAIVPSSALRSTRRMILNIETALAERAFNSAVSTPEYLERAVLDRLQEQYPFRADYGYDPESTRERGESRVSALLGLTGAKESVTFLELGCWDGMVSCALQNTGKITTAIDARTEGFDARAKDTGVKMQMMDVEALGFEDESFDFVFSFDAFEHFQRPEVALAEAIRVVKKGGYIFLNFGPLYHSAFGEHAYNTITVPYCQFLFTDEMINELAVENGLDEINSSHVNRYPLGKYRDMWDEFSDRLERIEYLESFDKWNVDLIRKYPSCFRSKTEDFDELLVSSIDVLFRRIS